VHSLSATAANVADINETANVLHGEERVVFADAGYIDVDQGQELKDHKVTQRVAMKRGKIKAMAEGELEELTTRAETREAQVRARVEHPFHVMKNLFRHRKVRYKGLDKNRALIYTLFALANLVIAKQALVA
jgi:transposase, IS5 family